jgi:hypothetical protein
VSPGKIPINRQVTIEIRDQLSSTRGVPPVPHQIADNGEQANKLDASLLHAGVGNVTDKRRSSAGGLDVGEDRVAFSAERESKEGGADVGCDAGDDDLGLVGGFDSGAEFGIVPGAVWWLVCDTVSCNDEDWGCVLDLSMAHNERRVGVKSEHLFGEGAVGALLSRGGHDDGKVEDLSDLGVSHHVVAVESGVPVTSKLVETNLEIENEQHLGRVLVRWKQSISLVEGYLTELFLSMRSQGTAG